MTVDMQPTGLRGPAEGEAWGLQAMPTPIGNEGGAGYEAMLA